MRRLAGLSSTVGSLVVIAVLLQGGWIPSGLPSSGGGAASPATPPLLTSASAPTILPPGGDTPTYLGSVQRYGTPQLEQLINASDAASLRPLWTFNETGSIESQPIVDRGVVYLGGVNGYEYAINSLTGAMIWQTFLGQATGDVGCGTTPLGIVSSPTVSGNTLLLYGGNDSFYDLNAVNGHVLWDVPVGSASQGYFGWGSPLVFKGYPYVGVASRCDKPLVPGGLLQISLSAHKVVNFFNTTAPGLVGNSIWSTPSLNATSNTIFVTTGNQNGTDPRGLGESIISLNATTLQMLHYWQVPAAQAVVDSDFGSTPTLFTPKGSPAMVAAVNKNGLLYAWYQSNLSLAWERNVSSGTTVTSASWSGSHLYVLAPATEIGANAYSSSLRELNGTTGAIIWQDGFSIPHSGYASPLWVRGTVIVAENQTVQIVNGVNGKVLETLSVAGSIAAPPTVSRGELYVDTGFGHLYAFDLTLQVKPSVSVPEGGEAPLIEDFTPGVQGGLPQYSYNWSFGDGSYSDVATPNHTFTSPGTYTVSLTVIDLAGTKVTKSFSITVAAAASAS
jgi:outer membrane protein assembly factor BamB